MLSTLLLLYQNKKKIIWGVVGGILLLLYSITLIVLFHYKGEVRDLELKAEKLKVKQQEEVIKINERNAEEGKKLSSFYSQQHKELLQQLKELRELNVGGKCHEQSYYDIGNRTAKRFNDGVL